MLAMPGNISASEASGRRTEIPALIVNGKIAYSGTVPSRARLKILICEAIKKH